MIHVGRKLRELMYLERGQRGEHRGAVLNPFCCRLTKTAISGKDPVSGLQIWARLRSGTQIHIGFLTLTL